VKSSKVTSDLKHLNHTSPLRKLVATGYLHQSSSFIDLNRIMNELYRGILLIYFISHIPITLLIDMQFLFPTAYPQFLKDIVNDQYLLKFNDYLFANPPIWAKSLLAFEVAQIPFYFFATYALLFKKNWIRIPSIVYGSHVVTAVALILSEFSFSERISSSQRMILFLFYLPYLITPLSLTVYMCLISKPFPKKDKAAKAM
jgi:EXPERA (EXPanded EBP superfamily)